MPRRPAMQVQPAGPHIAIIGMGFSGAAAAAALLRAHDDPFSLTLIEAGASYGQGVAYGEADAGDILNVRARDLSLICEEPGDFARWLERRHAGSDGRDLGQTFAPRLVFGRYVRETLEAELSKRADVAVRRCAGAAKRLARADGAFTIDVKGGEQVCADIAVLACGYGAGGRRARFGLNPYKEWPSDKVKSASRIALVGAGLTMIDALNRLRREGSTAEVTAISTRGLCPRPHLPDSPAALPWRGPPAASARELSRLLQDACRDAEAKGVPWQAVLNGFRSQAQSCWRGLPADEQARFLRHLRPYWDVHRHRIPIDAHRRLSEEIDQGRTTLRAGRVARVVGDGPAQVDVRFRGEGKSSTLAVDLAFDCAGHRPAIDSTLLRSVIDGGLAALDPHGAGLDVTPEGRVRSAGGVPNEALFAIGPLGAGALLEITGAPEIVVQARAMAARIDQFR